MIPMTAAYRAAMAAGGSVEITAYADLYVNGVKVYRCTVEDGSVTVDRSSSVRRVCTLTLSPDTAIIPADMTDWLAPNGSEIRPYFGIKYKTGTIETLPMGVFGITQAQVTDTGSDLQLVVQGQDRAWAIGRRGFLTPYTIPQGRNLAAAMLLVAQVNSPNVVANITPTAATSALATYDEGDRPWDALQDLAVSGGYEAFFDYTGTLVAQPIPDPHTQVVAWAFAEGRKSLFESLVHTFNADGVYNDYVVTSTSSDIDPPIRGEAKDATVSSPTYVLGPFGDCVQFVSSDYVQTSTAALTAATNLLTASLGSADMLTVTLPPFPAFDVDDVILITRARLGLTGAKFVVDTAVHSLRHDGLTTLTVRKVM
jgi:hypothetical protein